MGRRAIELGKKRKTLTLNIQSDLYEKFEELDIKNRSKFFNWLLEEHFNEIEGGKNDINKRS
jgi:hypothetical protein